MMNKNDYIKPTIVSEKAFEIQMGGISLFAQCYMVGAKNQKPNCKS